MRWHTAKLAKLLCEDEERRAKIGGLASYIEGNLDGLYSARALKDKIKAKEMMATSSGVIEKNIEVIIGRRFRWGMNWTREEAQNLLKLRLLRYDSADWLAFWRRQAAWG